MASRQTNPGDPAAPTRLTAKKKATKKLRSELTPAELAKLAAESSKKRNRWTKAAEKKAAAESTKKRNRLHRIYFSKLFCPCFGL
jgi:hypothetical protein